MPTLHNICEEDEFNGLIRHLDDRSHNFNKNAITFMFLFFFFAYKYLNVETKHLKIISALTIKYP